MLSTIDDVHLKFAECFEQEELKPLLYLLSKKMSEGYVCLPLSDLRQWQKDLPVHYKPSYLEKTLLKPSPLLAHSAQEYKPFMVSHNRLYLQRYYHYETQIIKGIQRLLLQTPEVWQQRVAALEEHRAYITNLLTDHRPVPTGVETTHWQAAALLLGALNNFTIITGGPGTGKTTTVRNLIALLYHIQPNLRVALAAPTGKAAARIGESLKSDALWDDENATTFLQNLQPLTIHRLLGWQKDSIYFKHNAQKPLPYDVIVVDECSMLDVALLAKLIDAIGAHTRLVLIGDKDQLASVEAGSIFGDLCRIPEVLNSWPQDQVAFINSFIAQPDKQITAYNDSSDASSIGNFIVALKRSHRFNDEEGIGRLSKAIISSDEAAMNHLLATPDAKVTIDNTYSEDLFEQFVAEYEDYIAEPDPKLALQKLQQAKVLCAVREGAQGLYATNKRIENCLQAKGLLQINSVYYLHRPIMLTQNRYDLNLFNGDTGIVRHHPVTGQLMAYFEDSSGAAQWVMPASLPQVETAYALTIHKSQGSEFDKILIVIPTSPDVAMLTRELIYTAITRAKRQVVLQCALPVLVAAMHRKVERASGIAVRLQQTQQTPN